MRISATITHVSDQTRDWSGPNGTVTFISGQFDDGSGWSVGAKPENAGKRIDEFKALVDKKGDFEVEPKQDYKGQKQWSLKEWPGKPQPGGGGGGFRGGGGGAGQSYKYSEQGAKEERDSIQRQTALIQAVLTSKDDTTKPTTAETVLEVADKYYAWLCRGIPSQPVQKTFDQLKQEAGMTTGDKIPAKGGKSVLEQTFDALAGYKRVGDIVKCSEYVQSQFEAGTLERSERAKLDLLSCQRAIDLAASELEFVQCESLLRALHQDKRLEEKDYFNFIGKYTSAKGKFDTLTQAGERF
jgi:hypothetical protein